MYTPLAFIHLLASLFKYKNRAKFSHAPPLLILLHCKNSLNVLHQLYQNFLFRGPTSKRLKLMIDISKSLNINALVIHIIVSSNIKRR